MTYFPCALVETKTQGKYDSAETNYQIIKQEIIM